MAALEIRMQQLRLPRELIYEQISFLPSSDCRARRLLTTNSFLHTAIAHGKNANNWRRPVPAKGKEAAYLYKSVEGINVRPLLPRIHTQEEHFPFPIGQFHKYAMPTTENSGILQYKMGVLLFIDEQIVPPAMTLCEARDNFCKHLISSRTRCKFSLFGSVDCVHIERCKDKAFDMLIIFFRNPIGLLKLARGLLFLIHTIKPIMDNFFRPTGSEQLVLKYAELRFNREVDIAELGAHGMEKEEASLFVRIRGTVRPLLPRIHTQGANRPFVIGDFNEYARPTTENSGILQYKMGVLLFIDEQIVPPEMEPQARGNLCRHLKTLIPAFQRAGSDCVQIQQNIQEEFAIVFLFFSNPIGILRLGEGLDTILGAILTALNDRAILLPP